ncbi:MULTISPECIES: nucleic acid/nucleotide deaminase domain-containing protein [Streptacidiphilus]|uniref:Nucleic acid/nucleotide deaminase domain-containing protein n=1 Tax=Streptacidiphilus cavernicola TaxID=3342716 RepID=A0ABV6UHK1_9ACTN|nr:nucleic acid/nucleotide deaminase domain-containing protein [Streptacidiphilus jeojiense]
MSGEIHEVFKDAATKVGKGLVKDFTDAYHGILKDTESGAGQVAKNAAEADAEHAAKLAALEKAREDLHGKIGDTPVYRLNDDLTVDRLTPHGAVPLTDEERAKLPLGLDEDGKVPKRPVGKDSPYNLPKIEEGETRPHVDSAEIPVGSTDLAAATQLARHEAGDYGTYRGTKFTSKNYAAVRYGKPGDADGFILVGRSKYPTHSERALGIPFLQEKTAAGVTELYTERAPCTNSVNCSAWMSEYMDPNMKVSHSIEYGSTEASRTAGNEAMRKYLDGLVPGGR